MGHDKNKEQYRECELDQKFVITQDIDEEEGGGKRGGKGRGRGGQGGKEGGEKEEGRKGVKNGKREGGKGKK